MKVLNKYQHRQPIGGHHYPEMGVTLRGDTMEEVVKKLKDLRITNGRPLGNPERDVIDFYSEHFPYMLVEDENAKAPDGVRDEYVRYRHWIFATWKNPPKKLVTHRQAGERRAACSLCPMMKKINWGSSEEAKELERRAFMLTAGFSLEGDVGYCACHRWSNDVACYLDPAETFTAKAKDAVVPEECWVGVL